MNNIWINGEISLINQFDTPESEGVNLNIINSELFNGKVKLNTFNCIAWNKSAHKVIQFNLGDNVLVFGRLNIHVKDDKINTEIIIKDIYKDIK